MLVARRRRFGLLLLGLLLLTTAGLPLSPVDGRQARAAETPTAAAASPTPTRVAATATATPPTTLFFPETGISIGGAFLETWRAGGGLARFGLPLTGERAELNEEDGRLSTVQWFERARFEYHPERQGTAQAVQFSQLGRQQLAGRATARAGSPAPDLDAERRLFPETGQAIAGPFRAYWEANGGLPVFGYPLTGRLRERDGRTGGELTVQYFERARFEEHAEGGVPRVRLGLIGRELLDQPQRFWWEAEEALGHNFTTAFVFAGSVLSRDQALYVASDAPPLGGDRYRARYRVRLTRPATYDFWGHLLSLNEASPLRWRIDDGAWQTADRRLPAVATVTLQEPHTYAWYRLAQLPLTAGWHSVELEVAPVGGRGPAIAGLDAFLLTSSVERLPTAEEARAGQAPAPTVALESDLGAAGAAWRRLHRGLAQGGEQTDPDYLARVAPQLRALGVKRLRLDHIFDYYDVVSRVDGRLVYDFTRLDTALDAVLAAGAEPFISLGLTPAVLSPGGTVNAPPSDLTAWRDLVFATVRHVNGTRGLGVRYWEVWNEPNLSAFWSGSFADYARLYSVTAEAVTAADATARVGGPATASHEYWVDALIDHAAASGTRLDFLSWHTYHLRLPMLANQAALIRRSLDRYPQFRASELIISEWSLHSDFGPRTGNVNDSHLVAAYAVAGLQVLTDAGVEAALFFEAIDGQPPPGQQAWGRWGLLTYEGQPKPVYHAFAALSRLHDLRLPAVSDDPRIGVMVTRDGERLALVAWHLAGEGQTGQPVRLRLTRPPAGLTSLRRWTIDAEHSRLGGGLDEVAPVAGQTADGAWTATLTLAPNSVTLLTSP